MNYGEELAESLHVTIKANALFLLDLASTSDRRSTTVDDSYWKSGPWAVGEFKCLGNLETKQKSDSNDAILLKLRDCSSGVSDRNMCAENALYSLLKRKKTFTNTLTGGFCSLQQPSCVESTADGTVYRSFHRSVSMDIEKSPTSRQDAVNRRKRINSAIDSGLEKTIMIKRNISWLPENAAIRSAVFCSWEVHGLHDFLNDLKFLSKVSAELTWSDRPKYLNARVVDSNKKHSVSKRIIVGNTFF